MTLRSDAEEIERSAVAESEMVVASAVTWNRFDAKAVTYFQTGVDVLGIGNGSEATSR